MTYEKPAVVTITLAELENATMDAMLCGEGSCSCQCQCQCQCQGQID